MKQVIKHGSWIKEILRFRCNDCWCIFESNEYWEKYWDIVEKCPDCNNIDTTILYE